jgi:hypothetical protein
VLFVGSDFKKNKYNARVVGLPNFYEFCCKIINDSVLHFSVFITLGQENPIQEHSAQYLNFF